MSVRLLPAIIVAFACVCLMNSEVQNQASAQTPGQIAAQNARNRAAQNALQQGAVQLPSDVLPRISRESAKRYITSRPSNATYYPNYGYPGSYGGYGYGGYNQGYGYGYGNYGYGNGYGYGYGNGFGYGNGYGYGYGIPVYVYPVTPSTPRPSNNTNRLPGSNYFGPPHASQYMGR